MSWFKTSFARGEAAQGEVGRFVEAARSLWFELGGPEGVRVYSSRALDREGVDLYFTEGAASLYERLLEDHRFHACEPLGEDDVALVVGFPDTSQRVNRA